VPELPEGEELASKLGTAGKRPVPLPRRLIRVLAKHGKPAEVIAAIAHLIRCLFKRGQGINLQGFVRAEWVAEVFGVSVRAVYAARAWLIGLQVLAQLPLHQYVMNKHGALFRVAVDKLGPTEPRRKSAGLLKRSTRSCTSNNQIKNNNNPAVRRGPGFLSKKLRNTTLTAIVPEDLRRLSRLEVLYRQAVRARWLEASEANARNFVAAAVRATRVSGDPVKIFVGIVKRKLWHHVTNDQEDRAREVMKRYSEKRPFAFHLGAEFQQVRRGEAREMKPILEKLVSNGLGVGESWRQYADLERVKLRALRTGLSLG
jgi:hypothetical protein